MRKDLGIGDRILGSPDHVMQTGSIDLADRVEAAGNAKAVRSPILIPSSGLFKLAA
jgi:hypothetical protein